ncbi:MAG: imidazole glycerol phosphate synthase subunit HisH, partial [Bacteroidia bacterium]|nr:imidazole glycerol phosphate synthase subunit HisH [Bacteroidia bacterium]
YLKQTGLDRLILSLKQPVLGICLGMQLMCSYSEEGSTECLKIFNQKVLKFKNPDSEKFKIPHTGWNNIFNYKSEIFNNIPEHEFVYFVHGYYVETGEYTVACSDYIHKFSAAIQKDNFYAVQFHPEKSGKTGEQILKNFVSI